MWESIPLILKIIAFLLPFLFEALRTKKEKAKGWDTNDNIQTFRKALDDGDVAPNLADQHDRVRETLRSR